MTKTSVLFVEDDLDFRDSIMEYLEMHGFGVVGLGSIGELLDNISSLNPDAIILDVHLPDGISLDVMEQIQQLCDAPMILLTVQAKVEDRIRGLEKGADYYLAKPVNPRELVAVIHTLTKKQLATREVKPDCWVYNIKEWTMTAPSGGIISLTSGENQIIAHLVAHQNEPVNRIDLFACLGKTNPSIEDRSLDNMISKIKRKQSDKNDKIPIKSVRGIGYQLSGDVIIL